MKIFTILAVMTMIGSAQVMANNCGKAEVTADQAKAGGTTTVDTSENPKADLLNGDQK